MGSNEVDSALSANREVVGRRLVVLAESQWLERKGAGIAPKDLASAIVALANAEGGIVVVGVSNGSVRGLQGQTKRINELRRTSVTFTQPPVRTRVEEVQCVNDDGEPDLLLVFRVDPSEVVHELTSGDCYLRVGDTSQRLNYSQRQELDFDKGTAQYDGLQANGVSMDDLDEVLVENYRVAAGASRDALALFGARSLLDRSGNLTNAAYLLFGKHPQDLFPEAHVRILRFLTTERGTGGRLNLDDEADIRIGGAIPWVVQEARRVIERLITKRRALGPDGTFQPIPIIPQDAWLEGLVNAVIHRSYSLGGDHIRVELYPDRIEIESPGRFPGLANPDRPLEISRFARNPRIARVCSDLRIGQELGEGIKRIFDEMQRVGLTDPIYRQTAGSVRLTLASLERLDAHTAAELPKDSQLVLDVLRSSGSPLSTGDIALRLDMSRPAVLKRLHALESKELILWHGNSPKDPRATWTLLAG